ncbi:MAG: PH domain-containing protein [Planctomycetes bacterium]|nr:PH domain-containing protein [Planctomycetota bacterium]
MIAGAAMSAVAFECSRREAFGFVLAGGGAFLALVGLSAWTRRLDLLAAALCVGPLLAGTHAVLDQTGSGLAAGGVLALGAMLLAAWVVGPAEVALNPGLAVPVALLVVGLASGAHPRARRLQITGEGLRAEWATRFREFSWEEIAEIRFKRRGPVAYEITLVAGAALHTIRGTTDRPRDLLDALRSVTGALNIPFVQ